MPQKLYTLTKFNKSIELDWISMSYPATACLCLTDKAYKRECKEFEIDKPHDMKHSTAMVTTWENTTIRKERYVIVVNTDHIIRTKLNNTQVFAVLAHEAVHVKQRLYEYIGEREPGRESEAYLVQSIAQFCMTNYLDYRKALKGK